MTRLASCTCGQLRVSCEGEPQRVSICHCLACQRRTGSAFGVQARFRDDQVRIEGAASEYVRTGDEGSHATFRFCATCGATVYWTNDSLAGSVAVAVGAFADPTFPAPKVIVYEVRRHPWVDLSSLEAERYE